MAERPYDPVHRARYAFHPEGENLVVETWLGPGGALPTHFHPRQEERWSVVEGEARFQLGSEKRMIGPADGEMIVRPGTKHALANLSDREVHLSCLALPALGLQSFLTESASAAREGLFMKGGIPKSLRGARWAAGFLERYRDDVVMTFPPQFVQRAMIAALARSGGEGEAVR
jgi:mannose-6-phosphate isomerase-like protein (cupin superfamily)